MSPLLRILIIVVVVLLVGGVAVLAMWQMPAPKTHVEKIIPNDRFPR